MKQGSAAARKRLYLGHQESPDQNPEHYTDVDFHGEFEFLIQIVQLRHFSSYIMRVRLRNGIHSIRNTLI